MSHMCHKNPVVQMSNRILQILNRIGITVLNRIGKQVSDNILPRLNNNEKMDYTQRIAVFKGPLDS